MNSNHFRLGIAVLVCAALVLLAACRETTPTPIVPPPPRVTPTVTPTNTPVPSPTPADFFVSILKRRLTRAELMDEIRKEGSVMVAGWNYAASPRLVEQFQDWVKNEYGVDVILNYAAEPSPATYLTNLYAARQANAPPPYDVFAVEENYYADALKNGAVETIYPSDLLRNWERVEPTLRREPNAIAFQSAATIAPTVHAAAVGDWFKDWQDLADERLKGRLTLPAAGDAVAGGFLLGLANALGKDVRDAAQMQEVIDYACTRIAPNVLKFTSDLNEQQELLRQDRIDAAVGWNLLARREGIAEPQSERDLTFRVMRSGLPAMNGYLWVPKGAPHPVLAQLFIEWRLSDDGQLPGEAWALSRPAWAEYHEGLLAESYAQRIPDWLTADYSRYYPSLSDIQNLYLAVDWENYAAHQAEWMQAYSKCAQ